MNHNERTHIPTVKQCAQCRHWSANCDSIAFERMPVAKTNPDGKRLVYCTCFQPAPLAQALNNFRQAATPFTSQPEVQALALIVAALRDGTGKEHGLVVDENAEYVRMVQMMIPLCNVITGMTIRERLGMDRPDMADAFRQDQVTSAAISASYRAPTPDQEPVTRRIGSLLSEFIRLYPHTPLSLSAEEVTALAHLRDFFSGRNSGKTTQEPKSVWWAATQWERALGICDMFKTYPDLLKPIKVTIPPTEDEQRIQAHRAIADALASPGADIKLPGHDVTADAVLAKMVNDILRQTQTKGHTFHTSEGAFVRCGEWPTNQPSNHP